ncbi:carcinine hydrolase/isopenicillin-N N-acyltransferase family protein [Francisella sp. SYW-9]|uniref:carcinine hydrolase/isopenicillin-N N-acyltransferase family protein n=1 Tax=Francisella sp. SYW-9 TaxID=2610888 RepID=UPI00123E141A|nr:carcinine hydrolase/isopenicillin-N N-acyltransferase family protein [Francisella sp. SYW-9]
MKNKYKIIIASVMSLAYISSFACTTMGFAGNIVKGGGTLIFKNRDAEIIGKERLEIFKFKQGNDFLALTYNTDSTVKGYPYIAGGTNSKGLTVLVNDPASHAPAAKNVDQIETTTVQNLLRNYSTVAEIEKNKAKIFSKNDPALYTVSDHKQVASFEEGYRGKYGYKVTDNGYVWNTNYYHLKGVNKQNEESITDITDRTNTLKEWLANMPKKVQLGDLTRLSASHYNGEYNSINRQFTVAKYFAVSPPNSKDTHLYIRFTIPTQKFNSYHLTINDEFFKNNPAGPLDNNKYGLLGSMNN